MGRTSPQRLAQIGLGILLLIVVRTLGEFFRLQYMLGDALALTQVTPYVGSALVTALVLGVALACYFAAQYRIVIGLVIATVALLLLYKLAVLG